MVIASNQAKFSAPPTSRLSLTPLDVSHLLAKTVGYCRAFELCAVGDVIDARRAEALGLVGIGATPSLRCATTKDRLPA
jgi:enoyl-CoA hydratase/carnithine racemase